ncbi:MAG: hypothetical protein JRN58_05200 [Nitrososphaerota archaeon]|nr:hypothetical protein [Nitrososphaerota archaeon]MDG6978460.1 hypothetical protein [Nitrososphaerota archaeon]
MAVPDVKGAVDVMRQFQALKCDLLAGEDVVLISGKHHVKRSGWRKIALAFNISVSLVDVQREKTADGKYVVRVRARATAPNGRFSEEIAVCDSSEFERGRLEGTLHNIESKAATRAINRAVSDLVGGGEVSAEEVQSGAEQQKEALAKPPDKSGMAKFTWQVKSGESPIRVDSGPYGFLRNKVL